MDTPDLSHRARQIADDIDRWYQAAAQDANRMPNPLALIEAGLQAALATKDAEIARLRD